MSGQDTLSQAEIDALLAAVAQEPTGGDERSDRLAQKVQNVDFRRQSKFNRDQLRTLEMLHETFSRLGGTYLSGALRSVAEISVLERRAGDLRRVHLVAARPGPDRHPRPLAPRDQRDPRLRPAARVHDDRPHSRGARPRVAAPAGAHGHRAAALAHVHRAPAARALHLVVRARGGRLLAAPHGDEPAVRADRAADRALRAPLVPDPGARVDRPHGALPALALDRARGQQPDRERLLLRGPRRGRHQELRQGLEDIASSCAPRSAPSS